MPPTIWPAVACGCCCCAPPRVRGCSFTPASCAMILGNLVDGQGHRAVKSLFAEHRHHRRPISPTLPSEECLRVRSRFRSSASGLDREKHDDGRDLNFSGPRPRASSSSTAYCWIGSPFVRVDRDHGDLCFRSRSTSPQRWLSWSMDCADMTWA